jgi:hypothetical protein
MNIHGTRIAFLAALVAVFVALVVAVPAFAELNNPPAKKGCTVTLQGPGAGQSIVYLDGHTFSVYGQNDHKDAHVHLHDGKWIETVSFTAGSTTLRSLTIFGTSRAVRTVGLR